MAEMPQTRYHAEVKGALDGKEVRINVFADTLQEVFRDMGIIVAELALPTNSKPETHFTQDPQPQQTGEIPVCKFCGSDKNMKFLTWSDAQGNPKSAWKCLACQKWHWQNDQGRGS